MPFYLYQVAYSTEAVKAMIANPTDRAAAASKLIEGIGGKLHHLFFAFGKYDVVCLIEAPDDAAMATAAMVVGASGTVSAAATTKLMTAGEAMAVMGKAGGAAAFYKSPMD
ncbi:GYD domain-containing protein [Amaricoccus sp.]|uniref:GYD domain-containing protein n=1 Tax=Amaricoccus sp. TaxID=1872485 RepID=UPI002CFDB92C|nr:GYD domain-containing protein [Amaricoccus sp.]HRW15468.1 GYD domain-containing protein [Amaricoccus sp.]